MEAAQQIFLVGDVAAINRDFDIRIFKLECDPAFENAVGARDEAEAVGNVAGKLKLVRNIVGTRSSRNTPLGDGFRHSSLPYGFILRCRTTSGTTGMRAPNPLIVRSIVVKY